MISKLEFDEIWPNEISNENIKWFAFYWIGVFLVFIITMEHSHKRGTGMGVTLYLCCQLFLGHNYMSTVGLVQAFNDWGFSCFYNNNGALA